MKFGDYLKQIRLENGLSQKELAAKMKVNNYTISDWERGRTQPRPFDILLLSYVLEVSTDELLGFDDPKVQKKIKEHLESK